VNIITKLARNKIITDELTNIDKQFRSLLPDLNESNLEECVADVGGFWMKRLTHPQAQLTK